MKYIPPQKFNDKLGLSCAKLSSAEATSYQLASKMQLIVSYFFCGWLGGWVVGWVGGWWVLKLKLMLTQPPTELELELGLSLAK